MEKRPNFTTIAVDKEVRDMLRSYKAHPRQSDNEILKDIFVGKKRVHKRKR